MEAFLGASHCESFPPAARSGTSRSRRVALIVVFAVVIFISKILLPSPLDKTILVVQATLLGLATIMLNPMGATTVATLGGLLTAAWRSSMAPFTIAFDVLYGLLVDTFSKLFKVKSGTGVVSSRRLLAAVTLATALTGMGAYYTTVFVLALLPRNPPLETAIFVIGFLNGLVGGYLADLLWRKAARHLAS